MLGQARRSLARRSSEADDLAVFRLEAGLPGGDEEEKRRSPRRRRRPALLLALVTLPLLLRFLAQTGARHAAALPLPDTRGAPSAAEQVCCGPAPCARPFTPPVVYLDTRDTTMLEALTCAWEPDEQAFSVTLVFSDERLPGSAVLDGLYRMWRLLCYGRTRDLETVLLEPGNGGRLRFPGSFAGASAWHQHAHAAASLPALLLEGRWQLYARTWNHLLHQEPDPSASYTRVMLPATRATRAATERALSLPLPWKRAQSQGALAAAAESSGGPQ